MDALVSAETLRTELAAAGQRPLLLDVRWNLGGPDGHREFLEGHLPGALWVDLERDLAGPPGSDGRHPLPDPQSFENAMRRLGLRDDRAVVAYDGAASLSAARLWWLLRDSGFANVRVLDGGFAAWLAAGGTVEHGPGRPVEPGDFTAHPGRLRPVGASEVAGRSGTVAVWDVRAPERYRGEKEPIDPVAGHIPGARNLPSAQNHEPGGRFLPADQLRERWSRVKPGDIVYCGSGVTAAQALLACELAGISGVRLYPGSWSNWVAESRPVELGDPQP